MSGLAVSLLISMATVGAAGVLICVVAGGGCWFWLRRRRRKLDQPEK